MSPQFRLSDLTADDQLLDRLAAGADADSEPVALLLAAIARHADATRVAQVPPPRTYRRRRALTALTALIVGVSGAGVAAAVSGPGDWLGEPSPRSVALEEDSPRTLTSPGLPRLTTPAVPAPAPLLASEGYTLVRDAAGQIVLLPPKVVVAAPLEPVGDADTAALDAPLGGVREHESGQAGSTKADRTDEPASAAVLAAGTGDPKPVRSTTKPAKPTPKPEEPAEPSTDLVGALTMAAAPQPPGQLVAELHRPSTPGTESGPGVPADPEPGPKSQTPADAAGPAQPGGPVPPRPDTSLPAMPAPETPDTGRPDSTPPGHADPAEPEVDKPEVDKPEADKSEAQKPETPAAERADSPAPVLVPAAPKAEKPVVTPVAPTPQIPRVDVPAEPPAAAAAEVPAAPAS